MADLDPTLRSLLLGGLLTLAWGGVIHWRGLSDRARPVGRFGIALLTVLIGGVLRTVELPGGFLLPLHWIGPGVSLLLFMAGPWIVGALADLPPLAPALTLLAFGAAAGLAALQNAAGVMLAATTLAALSLGFMVASRGRPKAPAWHIELLGYGLASLMILGEAGAGQHVPLIVLPVLLSTALVDLGITWIRAFLQSADLRLAARRYFYQRWLQTGEKPLIVLGGYVVAGLAVASIAAIYYGYRAMNIHLAIVLLILAPLGLAWHVTRVEANANPAAGRKRRFAWVVIAVVFAGIALRAPGLLHQGFLAWDDARFALIARDFLKTADLGWTGARPPYILAMGAVYALIGGAPSSAALVSLFAGVLEIGVVWAWGRRAGGNTAGLFAAGLVAVSTLQVWYSRWINSMSAAMLFLALAGYFYTRELKGTPSWGRLFGSAMAWGIAFTVHYAALLGAPFWLAFDFFRTRQQHQGWAAAVKRQAVMLTGLAIAPALWFTLMPPSNGLLPTIMRHSGFALGCCYWDELVISLQGGPGVAHAWDAAFYLRAIAAFEGWPGLALAMSAFAGGLIVWFRSRQPAWLFLLVATGGPLSLLVLSTTLGSAAQPRPLLTVLPGLSVLGGALLSAGVNWLRASLAPRADRYVAVVVLTGILLAGGLRARPMSNLSSPYAAVAAWLKDRKAEQVVVLFPGGRIRGYSFKFYLGENARFASEAEAVELCYTTSPDYLVADSEDFHNQAHALTSLPLAARFDNPVNAFVPVMYEETTNVSYVGELLLPDPAGQIWVFDMQNCVGYLR